MASYGTNLMITHMRERKRIIQASLLREIELSAMSLSRVGNNHQSPYMDTFVNLMDVMNLPFNTFFCPYLENVSLSTLALRDVLLQELERAHEETTALNKAKKLLGRFKKMDGFHTGINRQFVLSCTARIWEIEGNAPSKCIELTKEGIAITFPEFDPNTFKGDLLLFEEPNLIHMLALAYARDGDNPTAIALLKRISRGLARLHRDDRDRERMLAPTLLSLAHLLMKTGEYTQALETCDMGRDVSNRRNKGKYCADFAYIKAQLLLRLGQQSEIAGQLMPAYFGFMIMYRRKRADEVLAFAKEIGMEFETYGAENLLIQRPEPVIERGEPVTCKSVGELIFKLREAAKLSQGKLCKGICNVSSLSKIESGATKQGSVYHLEAFMQRLGRNIDDYFNTFLSLDDFNEKQMRDEVRTLRVGRRYEEAETLLKELEKKKAYQNGVNLQFVKISWADI